MRKITLVFALLLGIVLNAQVGINTDTPLSTLDIRGNLSLMVVNYSGGPVNSATPIIDGIYLNLTPTMNNREFILPDASTVPGRIYIIRNISDDEVAQIFSFGGQFFSGDSRTGVASVNMDPDLDGVNSPATNSPSKTIIFVSDGANWTYGFFHVP